MSNWDGSRSCGSFDFRDLRGMRVSTELGVLSLLTWVVLEAVAAGVSPPLEPPADFLGYADFVVRLEAVNSVYLLSIASLATGVSAIAYSCYRWLRPLPEPSIER